MKYICDSEICINRRSNYKIVHVATVLLSITFTSSAFLFSENNAKLIDMLHYTYSLSLLLK